MNPNTVFPKRAVDILVTKNITFLLVFASKDERQFPIRLSEWLQLILEAFQGLKTHTARLVPAHKRHITLKNNSKCSFTGQRSCLSSLTLRLFKLATRHKHGYRVKKHNAYSRTFRRENIVKTPFPTRVSVCKNPFWPVLVSPLNLWMASCHLN